MLLLLVAKPLRFLGFLEDWEVVSSFRKKKYFFVGCGGGCDVFRDNFS